MHLTLQDRQAIKVGSDTTLKNFIAVVQQVLGGDRCSDGPRGVTHIINSVFGREVLKHDLQLWKTFAQRNHHPINKQRFTIKDISLWVCHLTVHQERHPDSLHHFKYL